MTVFALVVPTIDRIPSSKPHELLPPLGIGAGLPMAKKYQTPPETHLVAREGFLIEVDDETSKRMGTVRQRDTKPEMIVRKVLHALGHRFRVDNPDLPGRPDIANRRRKWVIFVHGCYWHRHPGCRKATTPKRNKSFWEAKFLRNVERDHKNVIECNSMGYRTITIWECETENVDAMSSKLARLLPKS